MERSMKYLSTIQSIPLIRSDLQELAPSWGLPDAELKQITLIIEEMFSHTIRFAFEDETEHEVLVRISKLDRIISIEISDDGIPFNPLEYNPLPGNDPVGSEEWGMGLSLVKAFTDSIAYSRKENRNHLLIQKTIKSKPETEPQ
jgi:serine/threonine-protein kinase RsbW